MAINLIYRIDMEAPVPERSYTNSGPLTMRQIDSNMHSISSGFENVDTEVAQVKEELAQKAPITKPEFLGWIKIPQVANSTFPVPAEEGMLVYDTTNHKLVCYQNGKWDEVSSAQTLESYVKRSGDIMSGSLVSASLTSEGAAYALSPNDKAGAQVQRVATTDYVTTEAQRVIEERLSGNGNDDSITVGTGDLVVNQGDVWVNNGTIYGNLDMGIL